MSRLVRIIQVSTINHRREGILLILWAVNEHLAHLLSPALATYSFPIKWMAAKAQQPPEMAYDAFSLCMRSSWEGQREKSRHKGNTALRSNSAFCYPRSRIAGYILHLYSSKTKRHQQKNNKEALRKTSGCIRLRLLSEASPEGHLHQKIASLRASD